MMDSVKEIQIGNGRVIFKKEELREADIVATLKEVDDFIEKNPKLTRASDSSFIYFFDHQSETIRIGKEIIGFCSNDFLEDFELSAMDLSSSTIYSYTYDGDLDIDSILTKEKLIRQSEIFLPMWRVRISGTVGQLIRLEFWKS